MNKNKIKVNNIKNNNLILKELFNQKLIVCDLLNK